MTHWKFNNTGEISFRVQKKRIVVKNRIQFTGAMKKSLTLRYAHERTHGGFGGPSGAGAIEII